MRSGRSTAHENDAANQFRSEFLCHALVSTMECRLVEVIAVLEAQ
jgi:hypothetical protein